MDQLKNFANQAGGSGQNANAGANPQAAGQKEDYGDKG